MNLKHTLRSLAEATGLEIRKTSVYTSQKLRLQLLFSQLPIDLVLDVGANTGQFVHQCRAAGYKGEILSFEPSASAHAALLQSAASDPQWTVADRMALGATTGEVEINIAANSFSSSILPMLDSHLAAAPNSAYLQKEKVPLRRLDDVLVDLLPDILADHLAPAAPGRCIFLKLDVQGYEPQVLAGAKRLLHHTLAVQLEMSLLPLYDGETLMPQMQAAMTARGFDLWDLEPSFRDPATGRLLQIDAIFTRSSFNPSLDPSTSPTTPNRAKQPA
ncbi:MAG TPA: FkbM family methyltransferase [Edaphobacter sp.]|nr:FkbM family methyltransferase [Edaphobacter sp.]